MARGPRLGSRFERPITAARDRVEGTWAADFVQQLRALDAFNWTTIVGAELLWSVLPLMILLSSLANDRVDDDLSQHIGLNHQGATIVRGLFRHASGHSFVAIATGLLFALTGTLAIVSSLQVLYERAFHDEHRGWRDLPRYLVWLVAVSGALLFQAIVLTAVRDAVGPVVAVLVRFVFDTLFFWWTMHFLLAGRSSWRVLFRPALVTALFWIGLALFSSLAFSSTVESDSRLYGTIGVVFTLLTWFILVAMVIVLGAACGAVWQKRADAQEASAS